MGWKRDFKDAKRQESTPKTIAQTDRHTERHAHTHTVQPQPKDTKYSEPVDKCADGHAALSGL